MSDTPNPRSATGKIGLVIESQTTGNTTGNAMNIDHHDLHHEFPEHAEAIHALKIGNKHFARLFDEYHVLTSQVETLEARDSPVADVALEDMKKLRLKLKDELYALLQAGKA
jgi:uncharacterized protein YdcH (DUF465 family)